MTIKILELLNVSHKYLGKEGNLYVLKDVDLTLFAGEIVSIMGVSGSGKSTLLSISGLLMNASCGQVVICGKSTSLLKDREKSKFRLENVGFVYQKHFLLRDFNVQENVMMPLILKNELGVTKSIKVVQELLFKFNLLDKSSLMPSQLSGGECQRVAIARALASVPKLILADEPTGNLDAQHAKDAFVYLKDVVKEHRIACLIATHDPLIASMTDRTLYLKNSTLTSQ